MNIIFWIIMIIVNLFFILFALARAFANKESVERRLEVEEAISTITTMLVSPLLSIGILISTIISIIAIWG